VSDFHPSRRAFVAGATAAALGAATLGAPALLLASRRRADLVLRGGTVFDGTGAPGVEADVAVAGGRVVEVGPRLAGAGARELDARGLAVAPGFVDLHSHADGTLFADPAAESVVRQGVTTVVVGQDGSSPAAGRDEFAAFLARVDRARPAVNVAAMVGLGTVRGRVVGLADRPATAAELARMARLVDGALAAGACGASSGLEYTPGAFASRDELAALCRPLARRGLPYATHLRNEDDQLVEAVAEAVAVAEAAGCPLHLSHLKTQGPRNWGKLDAVFARVDAAAARGLDVTFDRYPYVAYATTLANLFPAWARDGGAAAFLARLTRRDAAPRLARRPSPRWRSSAGGTTCWSPTSPPPPTAPPRARASAPTPARAAPIRTTPRWGSCGGAAARSGWWASRCARRTSSASSPTHAAWWRATAARRRSPARRAAGTRTRARSAPSRACSPATCATGRCCRSPRRCTR
jgi:N-acyl-D-amino-acid deacylase